VLSTVPSQKLLRHSTQHLATRATSAPWRPLAFNTPQFQSESIRGFLMAEAQKELQLHNVAQFDLNQLQIF